MRTEDLRCAFLLTHAQGYSIRCAFSLSGEKVTPSRTSSSNHRRAWKSFMLHKVHFFVPRWNQSLKRKKNFHLKSKDHLTVRQTMPNLSYPRQEMQSSQILLRHVNTKAGLSFLVWKTCLMCDFKCNFVSQGYSFITSLRR